MEFMRNYCFLCKDKKNKRKLQWTPRAIFENIAKNLIFCNKGGRPYNEKINTNLLIFRHAA